MRNPVDAWHELVSMLDDTRDYLDTRRRGLHAWLPDHVINVEDRRRRRFLDLAWERFCKTCGVPNT